MFLMANIVGALALFAEAQLAWFAFSGIDHACSAVGITPLFPC